MSRTAVIIPVRGHHGGKSRLAPVLDPLQRSALVRSMARHVLTVVEATLDVGPVFIVTRDSDLNWLASDLASRGEVLRQPESLPGLNAALDLGRQAAIERHVDRLLVLSADLPCLQPADLVRMVESDGPVAIGPDRTGDGTNALLLGTPAVTDEFQFQFGDQSRRWHEREAERLGVPSEIIRTAGIAHDLDTPDDWDMLTPEARGRLLRHDQRSTSQPARMLVLETA